MRTKILYTALLLLFLCGGERAAAQFTVSGAADTTRRRIPGLGEQIHVVQLTQEKFYTPAQERADRRARRKERNLFEISARLSFSQTQYDNWIPGNDNTFMGLANLDITHVFRREKLSFETRFNSRYGMNYIDGKAFKNQDWFRVQNKASWNMARNWSYAATSELISQFTVGRASRTDDRKRSNFMSPGTWTIDIGFTYRKRPWDITLSPIGGNARFMLDDDLVAKDADGRPLPDARANWQVGSSVRLKFEKKFRRDIIELKSEAYGFTNYGKHPMSGWWETKIDIKATKYLTTTLFSRMNYNRTTLRIPHPDRIQHHYSLGLGLVYTFRNK
ncbi:MAG: DUF3078 domain-containing protein [Rikenellaceae bacterium]|nr:DUF3078 domain-containing protein [Rikenellaceae bacterium]MCL2692790.1 DUF3078 domain-containing protein [Rikenellaceae bacterium]